MKIQYTKLNFSKLLMLFAVNAVLISCGTYQHATIEDGIYANENDTKRKKKVVVVNERAYSDYNADYFAEELDLVDEINSEDIFLEEDEYNTIDSVNVSTEAEKTLAYTPNQSWGNEENNDVIININFRQDPYWMGDVWGFNPYRFNYWSFNRRRFNYWGWGNNYFYGNGWNNYYGWSHFDPFGWNNNIYGWNIYNRYRGTNVAYHRRGRYGSYGRRSNNVLGRRQLNNSRSVAYNNFTRKNKRKGRPNRNTNTIRNTRNTTSNIKPKPTRKTKKVKNTRAVQPKRTVRTRTKNTREPNRNTRTTRNTRSTFPSSNTRSTRSSSRSFGNSSSRGSSSRSSSRRKN